MASDIPLTRETIGNYQPANVQYSGLPAHVTSALSAGLIQQGEEAAAQSQKIHLMTLSTNMKQNLFRIEQENQGNPKGMADTFDTYKEGYFKNLPDEEKALLGEQFSSETMPALRRAMTIHRQGLDNDMGTKSLIGISQAQESMKRTAPQLFSNDPGAVYDAHRNMQAQQTIVDQTLDLKKSDGAPLFTPEQRASKSLMTDKIIAQSADEVWDARPLNEKLAIANQAVESGAGIPNRGGDFVKPYTDKQVTDIKGKVDAPSDYDQMFKDAAAANGLDWKDLKLHAVVESGLNPTATGPKTANGQSQGIMQLTEDTAKNLGVTDRNDPKQSIDAAAKLMKSNLDAAGGNSRMADQLYYGGTDRKKWGGNTAQYAENLAAVRGGTMKDTGTEFDFLDPKKKMQALKVVGDARDIQAMQFAPPADRIAIATKNGNPDVMSAAKKIDEALQKDPAAYVASAPDVVTAAQNAATSPSPESHAKYVQASLDMQAKMGVPAWQQAVLSDAQAKDIVGTVQDGFINRQDVHGQMIKLRMLYGDQWPRVSQELSKAKMPASAMVLAAMDKPLQEPYAKLLSTAIGEGEKTLFEALPVADKQGAKMAIQKQLTTSLDEFRNSTERQNGGTRTIADFQDAATMLAGKLMQTEALSPEKAADKAAAVLANDYFDYAATYRIPKQFKSGSVQNEADKELAGLADVQYVGGNDNDKAAYLNRLKHDGYWVNNPTGDGLMLKDSGGNYARRGDGSFINFQFQALQDKADAKAKEGMSHEELIRQMMLQQGGL